MKDKYDSLAEFCNDYGEEHKCCPICGSKNISMTLTGFLIDLSNPKKHVDKNHATCNDCKWGGWVHDLIPEGKEPKVVKQSKELEDINAFFISSVQEYLAGVVDRILKSKNDEILDTINKNIKWYDEDSKDRDNEDCYVTLNKGAKFALIMLKEQLGFPLSDEENDLIMNIHLK